MVGAVFLTLAVATGACNLLWSRRSSGSGRRREVLHRIDRYTS